MVAFALLSGAAQVSGSQSAEASTLRATAARIKGLLTEKRLADADREIDRLVRERPLSRNGRRLLEEVYLTLGYDPSIDGSVDAWCASGRSHAALVVRGIGRVRAAWRARGSGWADTVDPVAWPEFKAGLRLARADLEEAAARQPADPNAAAELIVVATGEGAPRDEMERWFEAAVRADAVAIRAYRAKLTHLLPKWHGTAEEAERFVSECERTAPPGSSVYTVRLDLLVEQAARSGDGKAFWARPDSSQALDRVMKRWLQDFPSSTEARTRLARILATRGDAAGALGLYGEALAIDPDHADILASRADLRRKQDDVAGAEADYRRCLALQPDHLEGLYGLAMIEAYERHQDAAARALLQRAAKDPGADRETLLELGRVCARQGDLQEALAAYGGAIRRDGQYAAAYLRRGMALWSTDRAGAMRDFDRVFTLGDADLQQRASRFTAFMSGREVACERGAAKACLELARRYAEGNQVPRDARRSDELFQKACRNGSQEGCAVGRRP
jgi:tetratricopeptide (TPR) repeat protein